MQASRLAGLRNVSREADVLTLVVRSQSKNRPTAPDRDRARGGAALLIVDMINCFDFEGGKVLQERAREIVGPIRALRKAMKPLGAPVVYLNDNFGEWHSEKSLLIERARKHSEEIVRQIAPRNDDYFVLKPQLSSFYSSSLPLLLPKLGVSHLILTGVATDKCVLFTAADAHMRDYAIWVPSDAVAAESEGQGSCALKIMRDALGAETTPSSELNPQAWLRSRAGGKAAD